MSKPRLRDLGIRLGRLATGPLNAITDVPGVAVGTVTVHRDAPTVVRSGVTAVVPEIGHPWDRPVFAGVHVLNGYGEMTGALWIAESGLLEGPVLITATHSVGAVHEAATAHMGVAIGADLGMPVVTETHDGWISDGFAFAVRREHVEAALDGAAAGPVAEGNTGGGTGMITHGFKGGTGTASRVVEVAGRAQTVGVVVQSNYGRRADLTLAGVPVGLAIGPDVVPAARETAPVTSPKPDGSIIVIVATDAPLLGDQCRRLAQRATVGLARVGGRGHDGSGDIFLCFSTGNRPEARDGLIEGLAAVPHRAISPLFDAVAEATEEAIWNALVAAETLHGREGRTIHALPHDLLVDAVRRYRPDLLAAG